MFSNVEYIFIPFSHHPLKFPVLVIWRKPTLISNVTVLGHRFDETVQCNCTEPQVWWNSRFTLVTTRLWQMSPSLTPEHRPTIQDTSSPVLDTWHGETVLNELHMDLIQDLLTCQSTCLVWYIYVIRPGCCLEANKYKLWQGTQW